MNTKEKIIIGKTGKVTLCLPDKEYKPKRNLGTIKDRTFYTIRIEDHLFRASNSFGINYKFLNEYGKYFDSVCFEYYGKYYFTSRAYFLHHGHFLHFKGNGLDKQILLPLEMFGGDKAKRFEIEQADRLKAKFSQLGRCIGDVSGTVKQIVQGGLF